MRKIFTSILTIFVLSAAIFTCCGQTKAFASLFSQSHVHDCCKKNTPTSSDHSDCQCHHDIAVAPSQSDMAQIFQNTLTQVPHFAFANMIVTNHLTMSSRYTNGPPVDQAISSIPLYYQHRTLRL